MYEIENECVDCGMPCLGDACMYRNVKRYYCDRCGEETGLWDYEGEELCRECLMKALEECKVEGSW